jgi:hypothetical protein
VDERKFSITANDLESLFPDYLWRARRDVRTDDRTQAALPQQRRQARP